MISSTHPHLRFTPGPALIMPQDIEVCTTFTPAMLGLCATCDWGEDEHPLPEHIEHLASVQACVRMYAQENGMVALIAVPPEHAILLRQAHGTPVRVALAYGTPREAFADVWEQIEAGT